MAGLDITKFLAEYGGKGEASYTADSAESVFAASPATVTAAFAANADGTQPQINRVRALLEIYGLNAAAVLTTVDFTVDDGSLTATVKSMPAAVAAVAARGAIFTVDIMLPADVAPTNIVNVNAIIATITNNNGKARLYAVGGP